MTSYFVLVRVEVDSQTQYRSAKNLYADSCSVINKVIAEIAFHVRKNGMCHEHIDTLTFLDSFSFLASMEKLDQMDAKNVLLIEMYQIYLYQNEGSMDYFPPTKRDKACSCLSLNKISNYKYFFILWKS